MAQSLAPLPKSIHADLLVGYNTADDAGVFRIAEDRALVQTVDFFPPIVDDPYQFGQIAAANAVSDIYAMGGKPLTALNIVCFPVKKHEPQILTRILHGASMKLNEAGVTIIGGHSVKDEEMKFGVAVTGLIHPDNVITNAGAKSGDKLFLTKPLGTGIITTAIKRDEVGDEITRIVIESMSKLNKTACELMLDYGVHSATDVTGYGLLGHAFEMTTASNVSIEFFSDKIPIIEGAVALAARGILTGGAEDNRKYLDGKVSFANNLDENLVHVMFDPQTSGGLLIAIPPDRADEFSAVLNAKSLYHEIVGQVASSQMFPLAVR